jgi:hypothetical protein
MATSTEEQLAAGQTKSMEEDSTQEVEEQLEAARLALLVLDFAKDAARIVPLQGRRLLNHVRRGARVFLQLVAIHLESEWLADIAGAGCVESSIAKAMERPGEVLYGRKWEKKNKRAEAPWPNIE